jgi:CarD family transcriptional regulator
VEPVIGARRLGPAGRIICDLEVTDVKALARAKTDTRKPEVKGKHELKKPVEAKKPPEREKALYAAGDLVVYPTHGVGKILGIERQDIAGLSINVFVVHFDKDRMTLRVPTTKAQGSGLRRLSSRKEMDTALTRLKGRSRAKRTMWSRRAQEYEAKINSGDPGSIAEVVRDLYRNAGQPEQSYSERQIYQAALDRLVREFAAVEKIDEPTAIRRLEQMLSAA